MTNTLRDFTNALPHAARRCFHYDQQLIIAVHRIAEHHDITRYAARISRGLEHRTRPETAKLLRHRLLRDAGMGDNEQEDDE